MRRVFHHWETWECIAAGMYELAPPAPMSKDEARDAYAAFLGDTSRFSRALDRVLIEWPISCEQFLSNEGTNRIAWLGQSSMCIETSVPACFRAGFKLLDESEQHAANGLAAEALTTWLRSPDGKRASAMRPEQRTAVPARGTAALVARYLAIWQQRGYPDGIPEEVPLALMRGNLAPSYRAIAIAILKNDASMQSLGFTPRRSRWYDELKRIEIAARPNVANHG